ncbi:MAG: hypothetical protein Kow00109_24580 [Acidobacteriota bacterium]
MDKLLAGDLDEAWELANQALDEEPNDPAAWYMLSQVEQARGNLHTALDAACEVLIRTKVVYDLFREGALLTAAEILWSLWEFEQAEEYVREVVESSPDRAEGWHLLGLILEFLDEKEEAEAAFARATELDPERFPQSEHISEQELYDLVDEVFASLPPELAKAAAEVAVVVQDLPTWELVEPESDEDPLPPDILGLFIGTPIGERGQALWEEPPKIFLFRRNLERACANWDQLREEILITVKHELAHYLGFDEAEMRRLGIE